MRRNQWGQYLVVPPERERGPVGYVRATTVAKTLDDGGGLIPWKATATMVGALRRPGLMAQWQALMTEHADPWYATKSSKDQCKALVEASAEAGGSTDRAELGTAVHAIVEQRNLGRAGTPILQPGLQADIDAYQAKIDAAGITFNPELLEAMVVLDGYQVAGSADILEAHVPTLGRVVADLKTGTDLKYSWQAIAVQLAIYAHADNVYVQGELADGRADRRLPMPDLNRDVGLVIHLPAGEARCELYVIDLAAGWEAFERSMWTRKWRKRDTLARLYVPGPVVAPPAFDGTAPPTPSSGSAPPEFDEPTTIVTAGATEREPADAPPCGPTPAVTAIPDFDAPTPPVAQSTAVPAPTQRTATAPVVEPARPLADIVHELGTEPDDGPPVDETTFAALQRTYGPLPAAAKEWFAQLVTQSQRHNVSFHALDRRFVRRFELIRGLVELTAADGVDDETLRCVLAGTPALIPPDIAHDGRVEPGHLVGSLDHVRAAEFARRCARLAAGDVPASVEETTGRVVLDFNGLAAAAA